MNPKDLIKEWHSKDWQADAFDKGKVPIEVFLETVCDRAEKAVRDARMETADAIYREFTEEVKRIGFKASDPVTTVVGELTRTLKRSTNRNGGTAYTVDGVKYDIDNNELAASGGEKGE